MLVLHVTDPAGDPLPGAEITTSVGGTQRRVTHTDGAGRVAVKDLPEGSIDLEASMEGFVTARVTLQMRRYCVTALTTPLDLGSLGVD